MVKDRYAGDFVSSNGENTEVILLFLEALNEFIKRSPFILESLNKDVIKFREAIGESGLASKLMEVAGNREIVGLIDIIAESAKEVKENDYRTSLTGLVRALTDEDIQRALAFILLVLKRLGMQLKD
ncbi:MAG: DUF1641 domain-containing protein [Aquificae bacterium]|nr:DUF1641 domain-containing protein [Aquificota bacterium]